jgi:hypothetical protein
MNGKGIVQTVLLLAVATLPARVSAQTDTRGAAAAAVVNQAFAAHERMEWGRLVLLIHPTALARMRADNLQSLRHTLRSRSEPEPRDPSIPEAVARWLEEQRQKHVSASDDMASLQALNVASLQEAEALGLEEFMIRWFAANDERAVMARAVKRLRPSLPDSLLRPELPISRRATVGSVVENDSVAHVLYRERYADAGAGMLAVMSLRQSQEGWRLWTFEGSQLFGNSSFSYIEVHDNAQEVKKLAGQTVSWDAGAVPAGRARLDGFATDTTTARVLIVESNNQRVRVPLAVFDKLLELLSITHMVAK